MEKFLIAMFSGFILGLIVTIASPYIYRHYLPKTNKSGKRKIMVDRPALILIFVLLLAATGLSWQTIKYSASRGNDVVDSQYIEKPYPVYDSQYDLVKVIDPSTIDLDNKGKTSRIKLIGAGPFNQTANAEQNTCFAKEANTKLSEYLTDKKIELEADATATASSTDPSLPRYIFVYGENINKKMIGDGYALASSDGAPYRYQADFLAAQEHAKTNRLGLWSGNICNLTAGNTGASSVFSAGTAPRSSGGSASFAGPSPAATQKFGSGDSPACSHIGDTAKAIGLGC